MKLPSIGITLRTALLSWLVALATLFIFVLVILPWQERNFLQALESKAHGVAVSLREVAAGAAVNEDYSSVVDHCKEMLSGDDGLAYLVFTKNDGFSLVQDRAGWRAENELSGEWRPAQRVATGSIGFVPLFHQRVYHYSQPFAYSGIDWGWIHVGLSLDSYDRSVASLYRLTIILSVLCGGLSGLASLVYARRLVRPLLDLKTTVQRVAAGDLSARAGAQRSDELGSLAASVNSMTEALLRRDEILASVQFAAQRFLGCSDWREVIDEVLAHLGGATRVSRAYLIENQPDLSIQLALQRRFEWVSSTATSSRLASSPADRSPDDPGFVHWANLFRRGEMIVARLSDLPAAHRAVLAAQNIRSLFVIPVLVKGAWWGYLGLDDCVAERFWSDAERDSLLAAADMLGATIDRQRTQDALIEAKATLEQRVAERTAALQAENRERREAEAALARSHSVINATLESTLDGIIVLGRDGRVKHVNQRFLQMWRIAPDRVISGTNRRIFSAAVAQLKNPRAFIKKALALHVAPLTESSDVLELKDGRIFECYTRPQHSDGVSDGRVWCIRDITDGKKAEAEIRYERDLLQTLLDSLPDDLFFKDLDSRFLRMSRSKVESSLRWLRSQHDLAHPPAGSQPYPAHLQDGDTMRLWLHGRTDFDVYDEASAKRCFDEEQQIIRTGQPVVGQIESIALPSGTIEWHLVTKMPWHNEAGAIIGTYGISKNITQIKEAEANLQALHQELMKASRLAGMAEVATGVLHNVGNVLNSVNVSATLVRDRLRTSEINTLARVATLLRSHGGDLAQFLADDAKGRLIPRFVIELADHLVKEHALLESEHEQLSTNVEHIKEIVAMQQAYAKVSGMLEEVRVVDILEGALQINSAGLARHSVEIVRQYAEVPTVTVDKHKVMQILVNIVHNAKYALDGVEPARRRLTLAIARRGNDRVAISVADTGIGIPPENLTRVFSHGFTTRPNGHGFGLHSGANAAREMGGLLRAESPGVGLGATFTLELPLDRPSTRHE